MKTTCNTGSQAASWNQKLTLANKQENLKEVCSLVNSMAPMLISFNKHTMITYVDIRGAE